MKKFKPKKELIALTKWTSHRSGGIDIIHNYNSLKTLSDWGNYSIKRRDKSAY